MKACMSDRPARCAGSVQTSTLTGEPALPQCTPTAPDHHPGCAELHLPLQGSRHGSYPCKIACPSSDIGDPAILSGTWRAKRVTAPSPYEPPKVWSWNKESGGRFAGINRPIAGSTHEAELPVGRHPLQLYSLATPNGVKVTVMLEELLAAGHSGAEYDAWLIKIDDGDQFGSGFVAINPNSKIPALLDRSGPKPIRVFETGAILVYLAEKFGEFLPTEAAARADCLSFLFLRMGSGRFLG